MCFTATACLTAVDLKRLSVNCSGPASVDHTRYAFSQVRISACARSTLELGNRQWSLSWDFSYPVGNKGIFVLCNQPQWQSGSWIQGLTLTGLQGLTDSSFPIASSPWGCLGHGRGVQSDGHCVLQSVQILCSVWLLGVRNHPSLQTPVSCLC